MSEPDSSRPGSILRAEREALGVTVREVSETLNLSIAVIEAIEADDHRRLPGPVFARGYLRAYARLLELEPEPLLAQYPRPPEPTLSRGAPQEPPVWEWIRRRPALVLGTAAGLGLLLLVLLVVWLWAGADEGGADATGGTDAAGAAEPAVPHAAPGMGAVSGPRTAGGEHAVGASDEFMSFASAEASAGPGHVRRLTERGEDRLAFTFTDDCWVEVQSATGARLYSDLSRGGSELVLVGQGPFRILLGYAPGAQLTFNGEPMSLAPHTRHNVATLVLGQ